MDQLRIAKNLLVSGVKKFLSKKEEGASMAEYAVLLAVITAAVITAAAALGDKVSNVIVRVTNAIS
jgi:Flp pilus assembly pilin Flp